MSAMNDEKKIVDQVLILNEMFTKKNTNNINKYILITSRRKR